MCVFVYACVFVCGDQTDLWMGLSYIITKHLPAPPESLICSFYCVGSVAAALRLQKDAFKLIKYQFTM